MKTVFGTSLFLLLGVGISGAQDNRDTSATRNDSSEHHNWSWVGLLGLAGLAGLRRKSETQSRLEGQGVNVRTVRT